MSSYIKPDVFIIGAPKCEITAMSIYLGEHQNIFISDPKEPHYFPKDQVFIGLLEELKGNPLDLYQRILQFLDVPYDNRTEFPVINANQEISNRFINTIKYSKLFDLFRGLKNKLGLKNHELMSWFYKKAYKKKKRDRLDERLKNSIREEFTTLFNKLEAIKNEDLSNCKIK